jgi:hypothetical protein
MKEAVFAICMLGLFVGCVEVGGSSSGAESKIEMCEGTDCGEGNTTTTTTTNE